MDLICTYVLVLCMGKLNRKNLFEFVKDNMFENTMVQVQLAKLYGTG